MQDALLFFILSLGQNLRALALAWEKGCGDYAIETKGQGWAAWNVRALKNFEITYLIANRGGDHLTGSDIPTQKMRLMSDPSAYACSRNLPLSDRRVWRIFSPNAGPSTL